MYINNKDNIWKILYYNFSNVKDFIFKKYICKVYILANI